MKNRLPILIFVVFILTITIPVIFGWIYADGYIFGGFVANPIDGQSYLAKMKEGYDGAWLFQLPFTSHPGDGQPLFLLYIFLGHISKFFGLPLIFVFHLSRVLSAGFLAFTLWVLIHKCVRLPLVNKSWALLLFGSGMGWLLILFSRNLPIDFYVAEMYPFLSAYTNPHFPLSIGILLWLFILSLEFDPKRGFLVLFVGGVLLCVILPFGIVLFACVYGCMFVSSLFEKKPVSLQPMVSVLLGGGILLLYEFYIIRKDPVLSLWDKQNITAAPDIITLLMGLLPCLFLVVIGARTLFKNELNPYLKLLFFWLCIGIILTYIPFNLQRRFLTGLYIPLAILGIVFLDTLQINRYRKNLIYAIILIVSIISNLLLVFNGMPVGKQNEALLFLEQSEYNGLLWVSNHTDTNTVVLASAETSLFIPGMTGSRVVYGHPFETVNADVQKELVNRFFRGGMGSTEEKDFLEDNEVKYIVSGPREKDLGNLTIKSNWYPVYAEKDISIYEIRK